MKYWLEIILILLIACLVASLIFANSGFEIVEAENVDLKEAYYLKDLSIKRYLEGG